MDYTVSPPFPRAPSRITSCGLEAATSVPDENPRRPRAQHGHCSVPRFMGGLEHPCVLVTASIPGGSPCGYLGTTTVMFGEGVKTRVFECGGGGQSP